MGRLDLSSTLGFVLFSVVLGGFSASPASALPATASSSISHPQAAAAAATVSTATALPSRNRRRPAEAADEEATTTTTSSSSSASASHPHLPTTPTVELSAAPLTPPTYAPIVTPPPSQDADLTNMGYRMETFYTCNTVGGQEHCGWHIPLVKAESPAARTDVRVVLAVVSCVAGVFVWGLV